MQLLVRRAATPLALLLAGLWTAGVLLRISIRDGVDALAWFYYATPWPVLAVVALMAAGIAGSRRRGAWAGVGMMACLVCALAWWRTSWVSHPAPPAAATWRLFFWNTGNASRQLERTIAVARAADADLLGFVEANTRTPGALARWQAAFPGYTVQPLRGRMLLLARGAIEEVARGSLNGRGYYHLLRVALAGHDLHVLLVDLASSPWRSRRPAFARIDQLVAENAGRELIVMGDFNTPRDSVHLAGLRRSLRHAFETAGSGLADTWPMPLPVLSLDHVWTTPSLAAVRCILGWNRVSDHRTVTVDLLR